MLKKKFGRRKKVRNMMMRNLACSLILHERIITTRAKGKELKTFLEKLISKVKKQYDRNPVNSMRTLVSILPDKKAVHKVYDILIEKYQDRRGGYARVLPYLKRSSDNADRVLVTLIE